MQLKSQPKSANLRKHVGIGRGGIISLVASLAVHSLSRERVMEHECVIKGKFARKINSTWYSQQVTHASTNRARHCLTSVIEREPVVPVWYGR